MGLPGGALLAFARGKAGRRGVLVAGETAGHLGVAVVVVVHGEVVEGVGGRRLGSLLALGTVLGCVRAGAKRAAEWRFLGEGGVDLVVDGLVDYAFLEESFEFLMKSVSMILCW